MARRAEVYAEVVAEEVAEVAAEEALEENPVARLEVRFQTRTLQLSARTEALSTTIPRLFHTATEESLKVVAVTAMVAVVATSTSP